MCVRRIKVNRCEVPYLKLLLESGNELDERVVYVVGDVVFKVGRFLLALTHTEHNQGVFR